MPNKTTNLNLTVYNASEASTVRFEEFWKNLCLKETAGIDLSALEIIDKELGAYRLLYGPQAPATTGKNGQLYIETTTPKLYQYKGNEWKEFKVEVDLSSYRKAAEQDIIDATKADTDYVDTQLATKQGVISDLDTIRSGAGAGSTAVQPDVMTSAIAVETTRATEAESGLATRIENLESRGRYLSTWDATTGKPDTEPTVTNYELRSGDYYLVGKVGTTNYQPDYVLVDEKPCYVKGHASTTQYTGELSVGDTYIFDLGSKNWTLVHDSEKKVNWGKIGGDLENQTDLKAALDNKVDKVVGKQLSTNDYTTDEKNKLAGIQASAKKVEGNVEVSSETPALTSIDIGGNTYKISVGIAEAKFKDITGEPTENTKLAAALNAKQDKITDLDTIKAGAALGATAVQHETGKGLFSGNYNDLTNKPTNISHFINDAGYLTEHQSLVDYRKKADQDIIDAGKQNKLTAGENITIDENNVISATGGVLLKTISFNTQDIVTPLETIDGKSWCVFKTDSIRETILDSENNQIIKVDLSSFGSAFPVPYVYIKRNVLQTLNNIPVVQYSFDNAGFEYKDTLDPNDPKIKMIKLGNGGAIYVKSLNRLYIAFSDLNLDTIWKAIYAKQDKLIAGENITISDDNVISAVGGAAQFTELEAKKLKWATAKGGIGYNIYEGEVTFDGSLEGKDISTLELIGWAKLSTDIPTKESIIDKDLKIVAEGEEQTITITEEEIQETDDYIMVNSASVIITKHDNVVLMDTYTFEEAGIYFIKDDSSSAYVSSFSYGDKILTWDGNISGKTLVIGMGYIAVHISDNVPDMTNINNKFECHSHSVEGLETSEYIYNLDIEDFDHEEGSDLYFNEEFAVIALNDATYQGVTFKKGISVIYIQQGSQMYYYIKKFKYDFVAAQKISDEFLNLPVPSYTEEDAGKYLKVDNYGDKIEWADISLDNVTGTGTFTLKSWSRSTYPYLNISPTTNIQFGKVELNDNNGTTRVTLSTANDGTVTANYLSDGNNSKLISEIISGSSGPTTYLKTVSYTDNVLNITNQDDVATSVTIPEAQVNSDWNATSGISRILNKPNLAAVATSGSYNDLSDKPAIPAAQIQSNWTQTDTGALDFIKNKPSFATVATSGNYNDLNNKPTIPPTVSGTDDGTNWTSITIGSTTKNIPAGGSGDNKMDKENPTGTGSFSLNRKADSTIGINSFVEGGGVCWGEMLIYFDAFEATSTILTCRANADDFANVKVGYNLTAKDNSSNKIIRTITNITFISSGTLYSIYNISINDGFGIASTEVASLWAQWSKVSAPNTASGDCSHAAGAGTVASGESSHTEGFGHSSAISTIQSISGNILTLSKKTFSHAHYTLGHLENGSQVFYTITDVSVDGLTITLNSTPKVQDTSNWSIVYGVASGAGAHAEGYLTTASGTCSHAEGHNTIAYSLDASGEEIYGAHAEGYNSWAIAAGSHAEGYSISQGLISHSEGSGSKTFGASSHAEGYNTITLGNSSHAEGDYTITASAYSHAEGCYTITMDSDCHSEGRGMYTTSNLVLTADYVANSNYINVKSITVALEKAVALRFTSLNKISGQLSIPVTNIITEIVQNETDYTIKFKNSLYSTAITSGTSLPYRILTSASYGASHAEGECTSAAGKASHAEGQYTIANHLAQHVLGQYNIQDSATTGAYERGNYIEIVGNGTSSARSNARTLDWNGNEVLSGSLTTTKVNIGTAELTEAKINKISDIDSKASAADLTAEVTARTEADAALNTRIDNVESRGRFLSGWNCTTGKPTTDPTSGIPYTYKAGDYYLISEIGDGTTPKYMPNGTEYTGEASTTTIPTGRTVSLGDYFNFDGTTWLIINNTQKTVSFSNIDGDPMSNTELATKFNAKQDKLPAYPNFDATKKYILGLKPNAGGTAYELYWVEDIMVREGE